MKHPMASPPLQAASDADIDALLGARHADPFALLGPHETASGRVLRAFLPGATHAWACHVEATAELARRHEAGFFEGPLPFPR